MKVSLRGLEWIQSTALGLTLALAPLAACTADTGDGVTQVSDPLKGGVPANAHGKGNVAQGAAGAASGGMDADAGAGKANGMGKGKAKKEKTHGGKAGTGAGGGLDVAGGGAADDDQGSDENP